MTARTVSKVTKSTKLDYQERLDELSALLRSCRSTLLAMEDLGLYKPSTENPSAAGEDFMMIMKGPDGALWPMNLNRQPFAAAAKLLRQ